MRCNGRLNLAYTLPYDARCPIILPRDDPLTKLIVKHYHDATYHGGTNQTLAALSELFWIPAGREAVRQWEKICRHCTRMKASTAEQLMAPIHPDRAQHSLRAFESVSIDYAGPFLTKQGRGRVRAKRYLCLITCMATRAVHLELAYSLTTDSFMQAFNRFISRRGVPSTVYSDNGTNFVGAVNDVNLLNVISGVKEKTAKKGVIWHFNPPAAPHFGGAHESLVKSAKLAIYAVLQNCDGNDEELQTCFTIAEDLLNSRPLTYQSAHPADDVPLTPNHFLHGQAGGRFAPNTDATGPLMQRWRQVQDIMERFWQRWMREWIPSLHPRTKWRRERRDLKKDDIVLVVSTDTPRGRWPLARVIDVFPGRDSHVRVVQLRLGNKIITRPISKVCPLKPADGDD